jgi:hypothetical protein
LGAGYFCEGIWVEMAGVRSFSLGAFGELEAGGTGLLGFWARGTGFLSVSWS